MLLSYIHNLIKKMCIFFFFFSILSIVPFILTQSVMDGWVYPSNSDAKAQMLSSMRESQAVPDHCKSVWTLGNFTYDAKKDRTSFCYEIATEAQSLDILKVTLFNITLKSEELVNSDVSMNSKWQLIDLNAIQYFTSYPIHQAQPFCVHLKTKYDPNPAFLFVTTSVGRCLMNVMGPLLRPKSIIIPGSPYIPALWIPQSILFTKLFRLNVNTTFLFAPHLTKETTTCIHQLISHPVYSNWKKVAPLSNSKSFDMYYSLVYPTSTKGLPTKTKQYLELLYFLEMKFYTCNDILNKLSYILPFNASVAQDRFNLPSLPPSLSSSSCSSYLSLPPLPSNLSLPCALSQMQSFIQMKLFFLKGRFKLIRTSKASKFSSSFVNLVPEKKGMCQVAHSLLNRVDPKSKMVLKTKIQTMVQKAARILKRPSVCAFQKKENRLVSLIKKLLPILASSKKALHQLQAFIQLQHALLHGNSWDGIPAHRWTSLGFTSMEDISQLKAILETPTGLSHLIKSMLGRMKPSARECIQTKIQTWLETKDINIHLIDLSHQQNKIPTTASSSSISCPFKKGNYLPMKCALTKIQSFIQLKYDVLQGKSISNKHKHLGGGIMATSNTTISFPSTSSHLMLKLAHSKHGFCQFVKHYLNRVHPQARVCLKKKIQKLVSKVTWIAKKEALCQSRTKPSLPFYSTTMATSCPSSSVSNFCSPQCAWKKLKQLVQWALLLNQSNEQFIHKAISQLTLKQKSNFEKIKPFLQTRKGLCQLSHHYLKRVSPSARQCLKHKFKILLSKYQI